MKKSEPAGDWLDRLILDESLASLDEDAGALLCAYAREHPDVEALREEARTVVELARGLCSELPVEPPAARRRPRGELLALKPLTAVAAAAVIGLGLGLLMGRPPAAPSQQTADSVPPAAPLSNRVSTQAMAAESAGWSARAWYQEARAKRRAGSVWSADRSVKEALVRQRRESP